MKIGFKKNIDIVLSLNGNEQALISEVLYQVKFFIVTRNDSKSLHSKRRFYIKSRKIK
jgi:hypothetical protein